MKTVLYILLLIPLLASAQKKKGHNIISPWYSRHTFYDAKGVRYDGIYPDKNYIFPQRTAAYCMGLQYERITRYGLSFSIGIQHGIRPFNIRIARSLAGYDPLAANNLQDAFYCDTIKTTLNYIGERIMIGYHRDINANWSASIRAGYSVKRFLNGMWSSGIILHSYYTDAGDWSFGQLATIRTYLGRQNQNIIGGKGLLHKRFFPSKIASFDFNFDIERRINFKCLKYVSFGIEGGALGFNPSKYSGVGDVEFIFYPTVDLSSRSRDHFEDLNKWMGVKVSAGFWWR